MTSGEAQEMLSRGLPTPMAAALRPRLAALAGRLGEWPLLLGLANGVVRARIARGASAGRRARVCRARDRAARHRPRVSARRSASPVAAPRGARSRSASSSWTPTSARASRNSRSSSRTPRFPSTRRASACGVRRRRSIRSTATICSLGWPSCRCCRSSISAAVSCACTTSCARCFARVRSRAAWQSSTASWWRISDEASDGDLAELSDVYGLRHLIAHLARRGRGRGGARAARRSDVALEQAATPRHPVAPRRLRRAVAPAMPRWT